MEEENDLEKKGTKEFNPLDLPLACVARVVKQALPEKILCGKDAKLAFARAATIFLLYLTDTANELCKQEKRSTIQAQDIFIALEKMEFDEFLEPLTKFLQTQRKDTEDKSGRKSPPIKKRKITKDDSSLT